MIDVRAGSVIIRTVAGPFASRAEADSHGSVLRDAANSAAVVDMTKSAVVVDVGSAHSAGVYCKRLKTHQCFHHITTFAA